MARKTLVAALVSAVLFLSASPALAADGASGSPPDRVRSLVVYGSDPCPRSSDDEIVVCAREPESERYRVPKRFRGQKKDPGGASWGSKVDDLESVSRVGTPNSCSPVGSGGQTGCYQQFIRQAREQRAQDKAEAAAIP